MRRSVNLQPTVARLRWTRGADEHPSNPSYPARFHSEIHVVHVLTQVP